MLNELLKLCRKKRKKTPLEDFTTEAFAGLLKIEEEIKQDFIKLLELREDRYEIKTQVRYKLENEKDSIIDIVLEGKNNLCFIENKVDAPEKKGQLIKYAKVLKNIENSNKDINVKLIYCTKKYEKIEFKEKFKDIESFKNEEFKQIRWFKIADILKMKKHRNKSIDNEFINFLKTHNMAQELNINAQSFITLENITNVISEIIGYLDNVNNSFNKYFDVNKLSENDRKDMLKYNRLVHLKENILPDGYSDIKYGFKLTTPKIYVGIFLNEHNTQFTEFNNFFKENKDFNFDDYGHGVTIKLEENLAVFINQDNPEEKISEWFDEAFKKIATLITETSSDFNWTLKIK